MSRRLACLSLPNFSMQIFLFERPEWKDEAVVLLNRDEANGRILEMNDKAAQLGLGRGMLYGPCLGIHRGLKAGVADEGRLSDWQERIENLLLHFSPVVERSDFLDGVWWLDASGLSTVFPSVRPWLEEIHSAIEGLGLSCSATSGFGRFSTHASNMKHGGSDGALDMKQSEQRDSRASLRIFREKKSEEAWFDSVPVSLFSVKTDTRQVLERLKIVSMGDLLKIPLPDIRRRIDADVAMLVDRIRRDEWLPLQGIHPPPPAEWSFPLEDPVSSAGPLCYVADRLIARCQEHARRLSLQVRSMRFVLEGRESSREFVVRPARPTRDEARLSRLFASRLEYVDLEDPVRGVLCIGSFTQAVTPQGTLFGVESQRRRDDARKVLSSLQAERGEDSVQYARVRKDPLPMRCFELLPWKDLSEVSGKIRPLTEVVSNGSMPLSRSRRVVLNPRSLKGAVRTIARVDYSGGWWDRPYSYRMAWAESRGRTCWLNSESSGSVWKLIGWLD